MATEAMNDRARDNRWVNKSDILRYARCPYSFWRLGQRMIRFEDTVSPFQMSLIREGRDFEDSVTEWAVTVPLDVWWSDVRSGRVGWNPPLLSNDRVALYGRPDGLKGDDGVLVPIEIKAHKRIQPSDELELAFYWLVLKPYQERRSRRARGLIVLRDWPGLGVPLPPVPMHSVDISHHRIDEVQELVERVRLARVEGVEPRACGCPACRHDPEIQRLVREREHVSLIFGVGWKYERVLADLGVTTFDHLLARDPQQLSEELRAAGLVGVTPMAVERWRWHATSYRRDEPVFFGTRLPVGTQYIVLDAEYDKDVVWLVGAGLARSGRLTDYRPFWGDNDEQQLRAVESLIAFVNAHPALPIVTWGGKGADVPTLRRHIRRLGMDPLTLAGIVDRHFDAFDYTKRSVRFPARWFGLKDVESSLNIRRRSRSVAGGQDAILLYAEYSRANSRTKKLLQERLVAYNREDLRGLVRIVEQLRAMSAHAPLPASASEPSRVPEPKTEPRRSAAESIRKAKTTSARMPILTTVDAMSDAIACPRCGRPLYASAFPDTGRGLCRHCWQVARRQVESKSQLPNRIPVPKGNSGPKVKPIANVVNDGSNAIVCPRCGRSLYPSAFPAAGRGLCRNCWQVARRQAASNAHRHHYTDRSCP